MYQRVPVASLEPPVSQTITVPYLVLEREREKRGEKDIGRVRSCTVEALLQPPYTRRVWEEGQSPVLRLPRVRRREAMDGS